MADPLALLAQVARWRYCSSVQPRDPRRTESLVQLRQRRLFSPHFKLYFPSVHRDMLITGVQELKRLGGTPSLVTLPDAGVEPRPTPVVASSAGTVRREPSSRHVRKPSRAR